MLGMMDCYGQTDVGRKREANEDQFLIADLNKSMRVHQTSLGLDHQTRLFGNSQAKLLLVADGMGGAAAGDRASTIAIDSITRYVLNTMDWFFRLDGHEEEIVEELKLSLQEVQRQIHAETKKIPRRQGMGTTLTMAYLIWPRLYVVHAGDSRCYLLRGGDFRQLTRDHTIAQQFVEGGALAPADAQGSRWSHLLWNVIGGDSEDLQVDFYRADLKIGDTLLLCTDGLTSELPDEQVATILQRTRSAEAAAKTLIESANQAGGRDNTTVVIARFLDRTDQPEQAHAEAELEDTEIYPPAKATELVEAL